MKTKMRRECQFSGVKKGEVTLISFFSFAQVHAEYILGDQGDSQGLAAGIDNELVALNLRRSLAHLCSWEKRTGYKTKIRTDRQK